MKKKNAEIENRNEQAVKGNDMTELVFIIDKSGSMSGLTSDTIGGFNSMIAHQREEGNNCLVTTVFFNQESEVIHDRLPLEDVPEITSKEYLPGGCTALIDAIGDAVKHVGEIHKYARPEDVPAHTMFVITTDGLENSSHKFSSKEVKKMIKDQKKKGWEFLFIGANIDSVETAANFGIDEDRAVNYRADKKGTRVLYDTVANAVCGMARCGKVEENWCSEIAEDYASRE